MARVVPSQVVTYIEGAFREIKTQPPGKPLSVHVDETVAARLNGLVSLAHQIPQELIQLDADDYSAYIANLGTIEITLDRWKIVGNAITLPSLKRIPNGLSPIQILHGLLFKCPDAFPSPDTTELQWVDDADLRQSLRLDLSSTNKALAEGEWKAATVLAGSVMEALLLWRLLKEDDAQVEKACHDLVTEKKLDKKPPTDQTFWNLHQYIEVTAALNLISDESAKQARLAKGFRDLIHPGREQRLGQQCDRATALTAAAAVEHIIRNLAEKPS